MRFCLLLLFAMLAVPANAASPNRIVFFSDGAYVEKERKVRDGYLEERLPPGYLENSLRVNSSSGSIRRVEVQPAKPDPRSAKEIATLTERAAQLRDRLRALETEEEIYSGAAKSQSSRALRKTKSNPDPLANARQGTDFAISRLERVYTARRRTDAELKLAESRLKEAGKSPTAAGSIARIWLSPKTATVRIAWLDTSLTWQPHYDLRLDDGTTLQLSLSARLPATERGAELAVSLHSCRDALSTSPCRVTPTPPPAQIAEWSVPLRKKSVTPGALPSISLSVDIPPGETLPAGNASLFYKGEYLGELQFKGGKPGEAIDILFAR